jgi:hypothetical protein
MEWRGGSSGRAPALQGQSPECNPLPRKKKESSHFIAATKLYNKTKRKARKQTKLMEEINREEKSKRKSMKPKVGSLNKLTKLTKGKGSGLKLQNLKMKWECYYQLCRNKRIIREFCAALHANHNGILFSHKQP